MSTNLEKLENNIAKLRIEVGPEKFEEGMKYSYNKNKSRINIQGFRKGKVPRKVIEAQYGPEVFYDDAINFVIPDAYSDAIKELKLDVVSRPSIDVEKVEKNEGLVFIAEVAVKPEVTLGEYKGIEIEKVETEVKDEDIENEIKNVQNKNARLITVSDRPVQNGDIVTIDFEGFIDGVAFEGGKGEDYDLEIGSHTFIDDFEEQLVGKNLADDIDVKVTFPEDYGKEELSNKEATFKVEIKDIKYKELPEVDDEFAKDVSEFDTLDEYKADIKSKLLERKKNQALQEKETKAMKKVIENSTIDIPEVMIEEQSDQMVREYAQRLKSQGLPLDMYLNYMGQTQEEFKNSFNQQSEFNIRSRYVLEAIAEKENFEVKEEDIEKELDEIAKRYSIKKDAFKNNMTENEKQALINDIKVQKALDLILDNLVEI